MESLLRRQGTLKDSYGLWAYAPSTGEFFGEAKIDA